MEKKKDGTKKVLCAGCGREITAGTIRQLAHRKYCDRCIAKRRRMQKRRSADRQGRRRSKLAVCDYCGKLFKKDVHASNARYCSEKCRSAASNRIYIKRCIICGKEFETKNPDTRTCSKRCARLFGEKLKRAAHESISSRSSDGRKSERIDMLMKRSGSSRSYAEMQKMQTAAMYARVDVKAIMRDIKSRERKHDDEKNTIV